MITDSFAEPNLQVLLEKVARDENFEKPRCFDAEIHVESKDGLFDVIVMENKKTQNFAVMDIKKGLNLDQQCRLSLEKLAIFHATSMASNILHPELTETYKKALSDGFWTIGNENILNDLKRGLRNGLDLLAEPYKKGNPVYDKLYQFYENFNEKFSQLYEPPEDLVCITHGDAWTNNMLFKINEDGIAEDVCLVDYQTCGFFSTVIDTSRILFFCITKELRDEHYENLLRFYFDEVTRILRSFGCDSEKIFPWSKFHDHLRRYSICGILLSILGLSLTLAYDTEIKTDVHTAEGELNFFDDTANIKDPENLKMISKWCTDIVVDAARWDLL